MLFEIHITVDNSQIWELKLYCAKHKYKCILAVAEKKDNKNQLMISVWKTGDFEKVKNEMLEISADMRKHDLNILREKIEMIADITNDESLLLLVNIIYYEYHIKIPYDNTNIRKFHQIACKHNAMLSFSAFKETINMLITLRYAGDMHKELINKRKNECIEYIKDILQISNFSIQSEIVLYDSCKDFDDGLFYT